MKRLSKTSPTVKLTVRVPMDIRDSGRAAGLKFGEICRNCIIKTVHKRLEKKKEESVRASVSQPIPDKDSHPQSERSEVNV